MDMEWTLDMGFGLVSGTQTEFQWTEWNGFDHNLLSLRTGPIGRAVSNKYIHLDKDKALCEVVAATLS